MATLAKKYDCGVYAITHKDSGKQYIGSSKNVTERLAGHLNLLSKNNHHNHHLQYAFNKHGRDAFVFKQILVCSPEDRINYEQSIMDGYKVTNKRHGYNISLTASHPTHSLETRKKISVALEKARGDGKRFGHYIPHTEEARVKMKRGVALARAAGKMVGNRKKHTEEAKKKMSQSHIGQPAWNKGVPMSKSAKAKMIESKRVLLESPVFLEKHNARKATHCKRGHEFLGDNLLIQNRKGWNLRVCRKCRNYRKKKCLDKKKGIS